MSTYNLSSDKIPPHILEIMTVFREILGKQIYDFMLIGATARDIILDGIHGLGVSRKTADVDFAVFVPEWDDYESLMSKLVSSGRFTRTRVTHKLMFDEAYEIDIVPFGDIQNEDGQYTWPPDNIKAMNVTGFTEVQNSGILIKIEHVDFKIASIPGICIMKILAWRDRGITDNRDGKDLGFILANYIDMIYDNLYALHEDLMLLPDFDRIITTARIMGRSMRELLGDNTIAIQTVQQILEKETVDDEYSRLALSMKDGGAIPFKTAYKSIIAMVTGLTENRN